MKSKTIAVALAVASCLVGVSALAEGKYGIFPSMGENFIVNKVSDSAPQEANSSEKVATEEANLDKLPATSAGPALTREDVLNEYLRAKEAGTLPPIPYGGDSGGSSN